MSDLTQKQQRFVDEYLVDLNATQAAIRAGYSQTTAGQQGFELLKKPEIQSAITERRLAIQEATHVTQERIIKEIAALAFSDMRAMFAPDGSLLPVHSLPDSIAAAVSSIKVVTKRVPGTDPVEVEHVSEIKLWDKNSAADKLMRHLGLYEQDNKQKSDPLAELLNAIGPRSAIQVVKDGK